MPTGRRPSGEEAESILKAKQEAPSEEGLMEKGIEGATEKNDCPCLTLFHSLDPLGISCKSPNGSNILANLWNPLANNGTLHFMNRNSLFEKICISTPL